MNKKNKTYSQFIIMVLWLLVSAVGVGTVYQIARNRPPVVYGNLTPDQVDKFNRLLKDNGENGGQFINELFNLEDWDNASDLGAQESLDWVKLEDANFIVYYKEDLKGVWKQNAELTLRLANKAIPDLKSTFGRYIYPKDINGRKLPIYLPPTPSAYGNTIRSLTNGACGDGNSIGKTVYLISPSGFLAKGIVLKNSTFSTQELYQNSIICVLPHELSHYVYEASYDYNRGEAPLNWVSEGIADYVAQRSAQVQGTDSIAFIENLCRLGADFPEKSGNFNDNQYWAGESFFNFVKDRYGRSAVAKFIEKTYHTSVEDALSSVFEGQDMHNEWVEALKGGNTPVLNSEEEEAETEG